MRFHSWFEVPCKNVGRVPRIGIFETWSLSLSCRVALTTKTSSEAVHALTAIIDIQSPECYSIISGFCRFPILETFPMWVPWVLWRVFIWQVRHLLVSSLPFIVQSMFGPSRMFLSLYFHIEKSVFVKFLHNSMNFGVKLPVLGWSSHCSHTCLAIISDQSY